MIRRLASEVGGLECRRGELGAAGACLAASCASGDRRPTIVAMAPSPHSRPRLPVRHVDQGFNFLISVIGQLGGEWIRIGQIPGVAALAVVG
jgi:hypothetical protein